MRAPFELRRIPRGIRRFLDEGDRTGVLEHEVSPSLHGRTTLSWGDALIIRHAPPGLGQSRTQSGDVSAEYVLDWKPASGTGLLAGVHLLRTRLDQFINLSAVIGAGDFSDEQKSIGLR